MWAVFLQTPVGSWLHGVIQCYTNQSTHIYPYLSNILRIVMTWLARFLVAQVKGLDGILQVGCGDLWWLGNPQVWTGKSADGFWLVVWNTNFMTFQTLGIIILTDFHVFQRGRYTTNQLQMDFGMCCHVIRPTVEHWMWCSCMVRPVVRRQGFCGSSYHRQNLRYVRWFLHVPTGITLR